jgi:hypothetical protein
MPFAIPCKKDQGAGVAGVCMYMICIVCVCVCERERGGGGGKVCESRGWVGLGGLR